MKTYLCFFAACILMLAACSQPGKQSRNTTSTTDSNQLTTTSTNQPQEDTIQYDENFYPTDTMCTVKMLTTGYFHNEEVDSNAHLQTWMGLFRNAKGFYLATTHITTQRAFDEITDENEQHPTGWHVETGNKDSCFILTDLLSLQNHSLPTVDLGLHAPMPGDSLHFTFQGKAYTMYATGGIREPNKDIPEYIEAYNYKLYISTEKDGKAVTDLLWATTFASKENYAIMFAGDMDDDGLPDFVLQTGFDEWTSIILYLSRPAAADKLVIPVAMQTTGGC